MTHLERYRIGQGLSQQQLSVCSNVSLKSIQAYEQGYRSINRAQALTVKKLADALNCRMERLLEDPEPHDD